MTRDRAAILRCVSSWAWAKAWLLASSLIVLALSHSAWGGRSPSLVRTVPAHATPVTQASQRRVVPQVDPAAAAAAARAYAAMRRRFAFVGGLYAASDARHSYAHVWPLSQALSASLAFGALPGGSAAAARADALRTVRVLTHYRLGRGYNSLPLPPLDRGGNLYYDDNNWIALDLLSGYRLLGMRTMLRRARGVFQFLVSGWDRNTGDSCPGGVFWARPPLRQIRATVSTANAALTALRLYQATGRRTYLAWAQRMYGWVSRCLAAGNGLYYDHLDSLGQVSRHEWTYNQGAMIAAGVLLGRATGKRSYLDQAQASARAALAHYRASRYKGEPPIYVAIFFSDLNLLQHVVQLPSYRTALLHYLRRHVTLRANGHFGSSLLFQAAAAQLYSLAAAST
jgi:hypothetical protein